MACNQVFVGKLLLTLLLTQILTIAKSRPLGPDEDVVKGRVRRGVLKFMAGGLAGMFIVHEIKKHKPCSFHGWGLTDKGHMEHQMAANKRCNHFFEKHRGDLAKCQGAQSADCSQVDGDTKCAVHMADGSVVAIVDCA